MGVTETFAWMLVYLLIGWVVGLYATEEDHLFRPGRSREVSKHIALWPVTVVLTARDVWREWRESNGETR